MKDEYFETSHSKKVFRKYSYDIFIIRNKYAIPIGWS